MGRGRVSRLMQLAGIRTVYRRPRTTIPDARHKVYPCLLKGPDITQADQVWAADICCLPMSRGCAYPAAMIGPGQPQVTLPEALQLHGRLLLRRGTGRSRHPLRSPEIFNSDQGSRFTSDDLTDVLKDHHVRMSMDGRGRFL